MTGLIFDISHYMLEDGPGIRTNVFVKGCPLRCLWCSNVYGLSGGVQMAFDQNRCCGCGRCLTVCKNGAISGTPGQPAGMDFSKCISCMDCVDVCAARARTRIGRRITVSEVVAEVRQDRMYYRRGDGGVTMSGGEILMQPEFVREVLRMCALDGINTAIETSGCGKWEDLKSLIPFSDTVFMDCKCVDSLLHKKLTGVENAVILENIRKAAALCRELGSRMVVRFPVIPGYNDAPKEVMAVAELAAGLAGNPLLNVLPYHNFGMGKYALVGRSYPLKEVKPPDGAYLARLEDLISEKNTNYSIGGYDI